MKQNCRLTFAFSLLPFAFFSLVVLLILSRLNGLAFGVIDLDAAVLRQHVTRLRRIADGDDLQVAQV